MPPPTALSRRHDSLQIYSLYSRPKVQDAARVPLHELYPLPQKSHACFLLWVQLRGFQLADISSRARHLTFHHLPHGLILASFTGREHQRCNPNFNGTPSPICSRATCVDFGWQADLIGRPIMDPKLLNELMEGKESATLLVKPALPLLGRSKSAEPLVKPNTSQDFSPLASRRPCAREDRFYRPDEHSE